MTEKRNSCGSCGTKQPLTPERRAAQIERIANIFARKGDAEGAARYKEVRGIQNRMDETRTLSDADRERLFTIAKSSDDSLLGMALGTALVTALQHGYLPSHSLLHVRAFGRRWLRGDEPVMQSLGCMVMQELKDRSELQRIWELASGPDPHTANVARRALRALT